MKIESYCAVLPLAWLERHSEVRTQLSQNCAVLSALGLGRRVEARVRWTE